METKDILATLRKKFNLTQEELAGKLFVTRQAVSRWEAGETVPGVDSLKMLSRLYDVSINTLLGSPRVLYCQCCGMPLEDHIMSREPDGTINEDYCQWCYTEGRFVYTTLKELVDFLVENRQNKSWAEAEARSFFEKQLSGLRYWNK